MRKKGGKVERKEELWKGTNEGGMKFGREEVKKKTNADAAFNDSEKIKLYKHTHSVNHTHTRKPNRIPCIVCIPATRE